MKPQKERMEAAIYFPLFLGLTRVAVWRCRLPLTLAAPVIWVGLEMLRGHLMTGFSWYFLGHSQYRWLELIQRRQGDPEVAMSLGGVRIELNGVAEMRDGIGVFPFILQQHA